MKKGLFYGVVLIGGYLLLSRATEGGRLLTTLGSVTNTSIRTLQGR